MVSAHPRPWAVVLITLAAVVTGACGTDALPASGSAAPAASLAPGKCNSVLQKGADSFNEKVTLTKRADGLEVGDFAIGCGAVAETGDMITVEYTGWLASGTEFDSSRNPGRTAYQLTLGSGTITGFSEGIVGMRVGGKRRVVIPPALGYGAQGSGTTIPPNSTLDFDIELVAVN